ncbi:hypothetical protein M407DRAFT_20915 [Tulasnella calospora MUT 4182]|uniref:F-box domain-containing protein n=1 Tax=Tulasnella calospora MUT 4182 TaxID=1051891 RepID=A0A0C3QFB1_9AGAM|nr:hypothetical protein M407DRAFT_20915 [Tulasnella calospora MUT 4182]
MDERTFSQCDEELSTLGTVQKQLEQGVPLVQKQLEQRVALVSRKRNTFAPINALPPELLVTIFKIALDFTHRGASSKHETLLLVCHHWNHLVNNTPSLWMKIRKTAGISNARIIHSLKKSKDSPLEITCNIVSSDMGRRTQGGFLSAIFPHAHRWRKASLSLGGDGRAFGPMAKISTPLLESISLSTDKAIRWAQDRPLNIFRGRPPPRLRELFLTGVPVPWSPKLFCNLNVLSISQMQHLAPSLDQLLAVLSACPCLESLAIRDVTFAGGTSAISLNTVHMAALGRLDLEEMEPEITNRLLAAIRAPDCKFGSLRCFLSGDPLEILFTSDISHFLDHMRSGAHAASITCGPVYTTLLWEGSWRIAVGLQNIGAAKGALNWLRPLPERNAPVFPLQVIINRSDSLLVQDILAVMADTEGLHRVIFGYDTPVAGALRLLATGSLVEGSTGRSFPELKEMWIQGSINDDGWEYLVSMLRRRQGEIDARDGAPPLRKVRFGGNGYTGDESKEISNFRLIHWPNRLEKVRRLLGPEGELVWYGRSVTEDGVLEDRLTS